MSWKGWCIACDVLSPFFVVCGLFLSLVTSFAAITSGDIVFYQHNKKTT